MYNHSNVWANIQVSGAPWEVHWDLTDNRNWKPLFGVMVGVARTPTRTYT